MSNVVRRRLRVEGRVQGVGFRPFIYRLAHRHGLGGWVLNGAGRVEIEIQGNPAACEAFARDVIAAAPPLARPVLRGVERRDPEDEGPFLIRASEGGEAPRIHVPPDHFACDDCRAEMSDPGERRYRYPFINCTQCGPRYTLIRAMPYDRPNTTMAGFPLCPACAAEYGDPLDRRFHAQPLACPICGPAVRWRVPGQQDSQGPEALGQVVAAIRAGLIVAVRGIGGYHLLCDAGSEPAVARLRARKRRPHKPLAVMVPEAGADRLDGVRRVAQPTPRQAAALAGPERPIVLVPRRPEAPLAPGIAPGLDEFGLMLPYSPLHHLLLGDLGAPVVATSGNLSGEPVLTDVAEADERLAGIADAFLHHDRPICRPADDPVLREIAGALRPLRIGRGTAPRELPLDPVAAAPMLAVGAYLKNTVALGLGDRAVVSPHIGDLAAARGRRVFEAVAADLPALHGVQAQRLVCDAHPDYPNTRWARRDARETRAVQHHAAHASAVAGEFGITESMLCLTWDGTGYGEDGTIWGGELLHGRPGAFARVGSLRPFRLPGGDRASRDGWRVAHALCWEAGFDGWVEQRAGLDLLRAAWERGFQAPVSSAAGRLFDAAAAMLGVVERSSYDGQGPIELEALAHRAVPGDRVTLPVSPDESGVQRIDWSPLLPMLVDESRSPAARARCFHESLADAAVALATAAASRLGAQVIGLAGGVFQNRLLTESVRQGLDAAGLQVLIPRLLPMNDAAIAYGQLVEATAQENRR